MPIFTFEIDGRMLKTVNAPTLDAGKRVAGVSSAGSFSALREDIDVFCHTCIHAGEIPLMHKPASCEDRMGWDDLLSCSPKTA